MGRSWLSAAKEGQQGGKGSRKNDGARELSVAGAAGVGRKGEARGSNVEVTGTGAQDAGCVCVCD